MRQNNKNNRGRGRGGRKSPNPLTRSYESNGPDVKVRGTAQHVAEKYLTLARDALSSGDSVAAENYFQHAEHYNRIIMTAQAQQSAARDEERRQQVAASGQSEQPSVDSGAQPTPPSGEEPQPSMGDVPVNGSSANGNAAASENGDTRNQDEQPRPRRRRPPSKPRARTSEEGDVEVKAKPADVSESIADNPPAFLLNE
ncbi:MAG: DUF4167 domain-containing protein [Hyphomicrobiales bacterium]